MHTPDNLVYEFGPFLLEPHVRRLSRAGATVSLPAPEFELLVLLVRNPGRVVEKREIMDAVWPEAEVEENNVTVRMSSLRRALGETKGNHPYIQTVTGRGYCLITPVKELPALSETVATATRSEPQPLIEATAPLNASAQKWTIRNIRLYGFVAVGLIAASVLYAAWWRRGRGEWQAQSMRMTRVTHTGRVAWAAVSPDGQNVAYVERDAELSSLWLQRTGANSPLQLLPPVKLIYKELAFSPDGNTLYYSKCQPSCRLHKMPILGGVETALPVRADCPVTFSPDGKRMAYVRVDAVGADTQMNLLTAHPDGTGEEALYTRPGGVTYQNGAVAWSPDGKTIALPILVEDGEQTYMKVIGVGVADRVETTLTKQRWRWIKDVSWLRDGGSLIINGRDEASAPELTMQIWRVPLTGGEPARITNDLNNYFRSSVATDGSTLIALQVQWTSSLWIAPAENPAAATQVTHGTLDRYDGNLGLSTAPDGRLVFVSHLSGNRDLWSVNADGSGLKQLTDRSHTDTNPAVTSDGRYVVFESNHERANNIWRVDADGRNPVRLTHGRYDAEPVCSPDGKWLFYVANDDGGNPKLRKVSIEGGEPVSLTDDFAQHPTVSPDGKVIAYYFMDKQRRERREIILIPAHGGAPLKTMPAPKNFGSILRWTPAGDSLTYRDNTLSGLWRMPLDGTPPTALMNVRGQRLHAFSYSPDGRRLVSASGPNLSDVVMLKRFH